MNKVNLFLIGFPRCGTTSIHNYLGQHKDIEVSDFKEPHFFCSDIHILSDLKWRKKYFYIRDFKTYNQLFKFNKKYSVDCSISYIYSEDAASNIKRYNPKAKIIIIKRSKKDFIKSMIRKDMKHIFPRGYDYNLISDFDQHIKMWSNYFDPLILEYEDFKRDNQKFMNNIFKWLELEETGLKKVRLNASGIRDNDSLYRKVIDTKLFCKIKMRFPLQVAKLGRMLNVR